MHYLFLVLVETEQTMEKPYEVMNPVCCCTGEVVEGLGLPDDRHPI